MNIVIVRSQKELDELPKSFDKFTIIEIRSSEVIRLKKNYGSSKVVARDSSAVIAWDLTTLEAWDSSKVVAHGSSKVIAYQSSSVVAHDSSTVEAWDSSKVSAYGASRIEAYQCATVLCYSQGVTIEKLLDNSRLIYKNPSCKRPNQIGQTAIVTEYEQLVNLTFGQWLERGYVMADGILKKHKKTKKIEDGLTLYEVFNGIEEEETSFVVTDGAHYSHGKTLRQAVSDLMFKKSKRDASKYKNIKPDQLMKIEDAIVMYRTITGACSHGVEEFLERNFKGREEVTVSEIVKITEGQYGHEQFKNFGWLK